MEIVLMLLIGAGTGWLTGKIFTGSGLGPFGNILVGIVGSTIGYWLLGELQINLGTGKINAILNGTFGAIVILFIVNVLFSSRRV